MTARTPDDTIDTEVEELLEELSALADERILAVNRRHGDDHAVNLSALRAIAKRLRARPDLVRPLWATGDTAARLLAVLVCRPKVLDADELHAMLREARTPKLQDWLVGYVVGKGPHAELLRSRWFADTDPDVAAAGWALTADAVVKHPDRVDLDGLLDLIETRLQEAPDRLQWQMNTCLAMIGIEHSEHRERALAIGEELEVLKDYPTPPNCTSPFAPTWIAEIVRRREAG